ncbi:UNVERIFIED_ORG: RluA family pseudouridine synthase [Anaplasma ovis]|uniref:RluA family pseudouridine synthase n=1 Tax=Anaplasma marginale TaxID=770 RepID=UPI000C7649C1
MKCVHEVCVTKEGDQQRIDKLISCALEISRNRAQGLIAGGQVTISGRVINNNSYLTKTGDVYTIVTAVQKPSTLSPNYDIDLKVVYEDHDVIVIDKDPYIAVHPGNGIEHHTITNALLARFGAGLQSVGSSSRPGIVHRLDKDTSGLMVAAKTENAYYRLSEELANQGFKKEYLAVAWGIPCPKRGVIHTNIRVKRSDITMMEAANSGGKPAKTEYEVEQELGEVASLIRCTLHTGRTHQIRVHMSHIGHSIVGDQKYGKNCKKCMRSGVPPDVKNFRRQALHASLLGFRHPSTGKYIEFTSKPADDIQQLISALERASNSQTKNPVGN